MTARPTYPVADVDLAWSDGNGGTVIVPAGARDGLTVDEYRARTSDLHAVCRECGRPADRRITLVDITMPGVPTFRQVERYVELIVDQCTAGEEHRREWWGAPVDAADVDARAAAR